LLLKEYIILYSNHLNGTLPDNLNLDLGYNNFEGPIPVDWYEGTNTMNSLWIMYLSNNRFSGSLPESFLNIAKGRARLIQLNDNLFTGTYPGKFDTNLLNVLELHRNNFDDINDDICDQDVFDGGEMTFFSADCRVCPCDGKNGASFCDQDRCY
jgi:hypothetical protein